MATTHGARRRNKRGEHVTTLKVADKDYLICRHCGDVMQFVLPMPIPVFVAMSNAFVKIHAGCEPQPAQVTERSTEDEASNNGEEETSEAGEAADHAAVDEQDQSA